MGKEGFDRGKITEEDLEYLIGGVRYLSGTAANPQETEAFGKVTARLDEELESHNYPRRGRIARVLFRRGNLKRLRQEQQATSLIRTKEEEHLLTGDVETVMSDTRWRVFYADVEPTNCHEVGPPEIITLYDPYNRSMPEEKQKAHFIEVKVPDETNPKVVHFYYPHINVQLHHTNLNEQGFCFGIGIWEGTDRPSGAKYNESQFWLLNSKEEKGFLVSYFGLHRVDENLDRYFRVRMPIQGKSYYGNKHEAELTPIEQNL